MQPTLDMHRPGTVPRPIDRNTGALDLGEQIRLVPSVHPDEYRYFLGIDGMGQAQIHCETDFAGGLRWELTGPPETDTIILLVTSESLGN